MEGSFFEKLKKGMSIEETGGEESKTEKSDEIKEIAVELKTEESPSSEIIEDKEKKEKEKKMKKKEKAEPKKATSEKEKWPKLPWHRLGCLRKPPACPIRFPAEKRSGLRLPDPL